jgi:hypothetical protein
LEGRFFCARNFQLREHERPPWAWIASVIHSHFVAKRVFDDINRCWLRGERFADCNLRVTGYRAAGGFERFGFWNVSAARGSHILALKIQWPLTRGARKNRTQSLLATTARGGGFGFSEKSPKRQNSWLDRSRSVGMLP